MELLEVPSNIPFMFAICRSAGLGARLSVLRRDGQPNRHGPKVVVRIGLPTVAVKAIFMPPAGGEGTTGWRPWDTDNSGVAIDGTA